MRVVGGVGEDGWECCCCLLHLHPIPPLCLCLPLVALLWLLMILLLPPRSADMEDKDGVSLPSYRGDIINGPEFTPGEGERRQLGQLCSSSSSSSCSCSIPPMQR